MILDEQIRVMFYSFIYGMFYLTSYKFFKKFKIKKMLVTIILNTIFCFSHVSLFYYLLYLINKGILSIYIMIFFILGIFICHLLYFNDKNNLNF